MLIPNPLFVAGSPARRRNVANPTSPFTPAVRAVADNRVHVPHPFYSTQPRPAAPFARRVLANTNRNMLIWTPLMPGAFEKARDATVFTRLGTRHANYELASAIMSTVNIDETFCLYVHNVLLVFSASDEEHTGHVRRVLKMMQDRSMRADLQNCVFNVDKSVDAGVVLGERYEQRAFLVINEGVARRVERHYY